MPQLSLYLDDAAMDRLREKAASEHVSLSKYASNCIAREPVRSSWPNGFWDLYGSIEDDSFERPEELDYVLDAPRPTL